MKFKWKWYTPHDTPYHQSSSKLIIYYGNENVCLLSLVNYWNHRYMDNMLTGTWTSKLLDLSKVTLGLTSEFTSFLTPPSLMVSLGPSLMTFLTSPSVLDFLTTPSELLTVALGFLFYSNISSLASITDCEALISSISLGKTLNMSETSFFCCKFDFL